jgi:alpha-amylase/alpha-mannosidase (GH57 family)
MPTTGGERYVCIHGHFYQPPRENPWLEAIEVQDSAVPYHDWNERVTVECYAPNTAARLLDADSYITALRNNYSRISFNFGPTLLSWMEHARPDVYAEILRADQESCRRLGRGNALAQVYGHCIMPLASPRDQQTQVRWAIADFSHRFGRRPDGMWLPETAVDRRTLEVLARNGIRFTILAPGQAARVRHSGGDWQPVERGHIECSRPYRCSVAPGVDITLFFYDGDISHAVAFEGLLNDGRNLARRLTDGGAARNDGALVHIATDGESYGHHHRFGDMALAAAIEAIDAEGAVQLTNYAAYLDRAPVQDDVEIHENTSWSCGHGIERWRAHCGCNSGGHPGWQQEWRAPLRQALDWLKAQLDDLFERHGAKVLHDPWAARDAYVGVLLQRDEEHRQAFLERHAVGRGRSRERARIWKLLEMQRYGLLSFTSCGWFFDECSGIETVQILTYAARALQLAAEFGSNLEPEFVHRLQPMRSNLPQYQDGRHVYRQLVRPQVTDGSRMMAHYAMHSLFTAPVPEHVYAYRVVTTERSAEHAGSAVFAVGQARLVAEATEQSEDYVYAALHLGGHDMHCAVAPSTPKIDYPQLKSELLATFFAEPLTELVRRIDRAFGGTFYTLRDVFVAERRRILDQVMARAMADCTADYERMVTNNRRLLDFLAQAWVPLPEELRIAATFVVQRRLEETTARFVAGTDTAPAILAAWSDAARWRVTPSTAGVARLLEEALARVVGRLQTADAAANVAQAHTICDVAQSLGLTLNTWEAQGRYYALVTGESARCWPRHLLAEVRRLGERLRFRLREWATLAERAA